MNEVTLEGKCTGMDLRNELINLIDNVPDERWKSGKFWVFILNGSCKFQLKPIWKKDQPRRGVISFWDMDRFGEPPPYIPHSGHEGLVEHLEDGITGKYEELLDRRFDVTKPNSSNKHFQLFVLFQFEIARRVPGDYHDPPTRRQTAVAIGIALKLQTIEAYQTLIEMFSAFSPNWAHPVRLEQYIKLRRLQESNEKKQGEEHDEGEEQDEVDHLTKRFAIDL